MLFRATTALRKIQALNKRLRCVQGGTSAGKSIAILLLLIQAAQTDESPTLTSIVSESFPHLKRGVMRDFLTIMQSHEYFDPDAWNMTDFIYTFPTGSKIEFFSADQPSKVRGPRRDRLFINEANNVPFEAFDQLEVRTKDYIFMDWNPVNEFWYHEHIQGKRDDYEFIIVTYLDNEGLDARIVASIEQRKENRNWWTVFGRGELGFSEAQIFKDWEIVEKVPQEARLERYGLDFGYTCFIGSTLIRTERGDIPISQIRAGDLVLTRSGLRSVKNVFMNGLSEVIDREFLFSDGTKKRIAGTPDHHFNVNDLWKPLSKISKNDRLYILKERSSLDTGMENIQTISTTSVSLVEKLKHLFSIERFTKSILEKYQKVLLFITLTATRLIMTFQIWLLFHLLSTLNSITFWLNGTKVKTVKKQGRASNFQSKIGHFGERRRCRSFLKVPYFVSGAARSLLLRIPIKSFVQKSVITVGNIFHQKMRCLSYAKTAEAGSRGISTSNKDLAQQNAQICSLYVKEAKTIRSWREPVFNIEVEGLHEYFADGFLVFNCDPSALIAVYRYNGGFLFDERVYEKGLPNRVIADRIIQQPERALVIADSAEPKSIDEIRGYGVNITGCRKGPGSVSQRIQFLQDQKVYVTKQSTNLIRDYRNYLWKSDRDGKILNEPEHAFSHGPDACMYALDDYRERPEAVVKRRATNPYIRR